MVEQQQIPQEVIEFERSRAQLMNVSNQKQQLQVQSRALSLSLEELKKTKETKVYKAVGNILILSDVKNVEKELSEQKESVDLRTKTLQKQEDTLIEQLNKLKSKIESGEKEKAKK